MNISGYIVTDNMGLSSTGSVLVHNFEFFAMTSPFDMTATFDGKIGLSRPYYSLNYNTGPLFVQ